MTSSDTSEHGTCSACGPWWRLPLLLALVFIAVLLGRLYSVRQTRTSVEDAQAAERLRTAERLAAAASSGKTVSLAIDLGDGVPRLYDDVAWHEAMTVEDLLAAVSRMPGGPRFARQGSGASALLAEIDGTANEGSEGRNWVYFVNDRRGDRSFAVYRLEPGDRVLWKFAVQE